MKFLDALVIQLVEVIARMGDHKLPQLVLVCLQEDLFQSIHDLLLFLANWLVQLAFEVV